MTSDSLVVSPSAVLQTDSLTNASLLRVTWSSNPSALPSSLRRGSFSGSGEWAIKLDTSVGADNGDHPGYARRLEDELASTGVLNAAVSPVAPEMTHRRQGTQTSADYALLFSSRPVVQAPSRITSADEKANGGTNSYAVYFLFNNSHPSPESITLEYTPQIWSPSANPIISDPIRVQPAPPDVDFLTPWANARLSDLRALASIARELLTSGSRNLGPGLVKSGVVGSGMDLSAIEAENKMVYEEMQWVRDLLLAVSRSGIFSGYGIGEVDEEAEEVEEEREAIERALEEMRIRTEELKIKNSNEATSPLQPVIHPRLVPPTIGSSSPRPRGPALNTSLATSPPLQQQHAKSLATAIHLHTPESTSRPSPSDENPEAGLFAYPLSPRSPDMPLSPFSALKGFPDQLPLPRQSSSLNSASMGQKRGNVPQALNIPKSPAHGPGGLKSPLSPGIRDEMAGIVVRSPREPKTPTLSIPGVEALKKKRNWGAEKA